MLFIDPQRYIQELQKAPSALRVLSGSEETAEAIRAIGNKHKLGEKVSHVARITAYVLVGLLPLYKFRETIQAEIGTDENTARTIAIEIRSKVFSRAVEELRAIHGLHANPPQKP